MIDTATYSHIFTADAAIDYFALLTITLLAFAMRVTSIIRLPLRHYYNWLMLVYNIDDAAFVSTFRRQWAAMLIQIHFFHWFIVLHSNLFRQWAYWRYRLIFTIISHISYLRNYLPSLLYIITDAWLTWEYCWISLISLISFSFITSKQMLAFRRKFTHTITKISQIFLLHTMQ
jgi:hypothetical protein